MPTIASTFFVCFLCGVTAQSSTTSSTTPLGEEPMIKNAQSGIPEKSEHPSEEAMSSEETGGWLDGTWRCCELLTVMDEGKGPKGRPGKSGSPGAKGDAGAKGHPGLKGPQGVPGSKGPVGNKGEKGERGPIGLMGPTGDKGDRGSEGDPGIKGGKGEKGDRGELGENGKNGLKGDKGIKGEHGEASAKGIKGDPGERAASGDKGVKGEHGERGVFGPKGERGVSGLKGAKGDRGQPGKPGPAYVRGNIQGAAGSLHLSDSSQVLDFPGLGCYRCPAGPPGRTGRPGSPGRLGPRGSPGVPGIQGPPGSSGYCRQPTSRESDGDESNERRRRAAFSVGVSWSTKDDAPGKLKRGMRFDKVVQDQAGSYDPENARFTCPTSGIYAFGFQLTAGAKATLWRNSKATLGGLEHQDDQSSALTLLHLQNGDQVWLDVHGGNEKPVQGGDDAMFIGILLLPDEDTDD